VLARKIEWPSAAATAAFDHRHTEALGSVRKMKACKNDQTFEASGQKS